MLNDDRIFVKKITEVIKPSYGLLEKNKKFVWEKNHQKFLKKYNANENQI